MKDFSYLFTAWMAVWAIFFAYSVSIGRRTTQLREEIERLKQQIRED
jgi:CcmD family protein